MLNFANKKLAVAEWWFFSHLTQIYWMRDTALQHLKHSHLRQHSRGLGRKQYHQKVNTSRLNKGYS